MGDTKRWLRGARIDPAAVTSRTTLTELIDGAFLAYNGARLREEIARRPSHLRHGCAARRERRRREREREHACDESAAQHLDRRRRYW